MRVIVDKSNSAARLYGCTFLANQSVPVRVGLPLSHHARPFHCGEETVEAGGFNYAAAAEAKNAENVLVLHDPLVAHRYGKLWDRLWAESDELKGRY